MPTPEDVEIPGPPAETRAADDAGPEVVPAPGPQAGPAAGGLPDLSALLGLLGGGAGAEPMALLQSQLGGLGSDNPAMAALMQMMQARRAPEATSGGIEDARLIEPRRDLVAQADLEELLAQSRLVEAEAEVLRERNDILARPSAPATCAGARTRAAAAVTAVAAPARAGRSAWRSAATSRPRCGACRKCRSHPAAKAAASTSGRAPQAPFRRIPRRSANHPATSRDSAEG